MPSRARKRDMSSLLPLAAIEPDGLIVTTDGRYVRVVECDQVPNPITAGGDALQRIDAGWAGLCASIPDGQALSFIVQSDPLPVLDVIERDRHNAALAIAEDERAGRDDLAVTRRRLLAAQSETVRVGSESLAAASVRYFVVVPWRPDRSLRAQLGALRPSAGGTVRTSWAAHQRAAQESLRYADTVIASLAGLGIDARLLGPVEQLAYLWERLHPAADELPDFDAFEHAAGIVSATDQHAARDVRHNLLDLIAGDAGWSVREHAGRIMRHTDGAVEEVLHLATQPASTSPWWLAYLLETPLSSTLAVHVRVDDRARSRTRERRRWARLRTSLQYKERRGHLIGHDEREALREAEELDAELISSARAALYRVSVYYAARRVDGDAEVLDQTLTSVAREFPGLTEARVARGRWVNPAAWASTLPLGTDHLRATRRYAHRNIGHCVPFCSADNGFPDGLLLGWSDPQRLLTRIDPFDSKLQTHVSLSVGPTGGGKTVTTNALLLRAISRGMRGYIIDRSSSATADGRGQGHYETLIAHVPGAEKIYVGTGSGAVICPWDVPDPGAVSPEKIELLRALHGLLIGDRHGDDRELTALDEALLDRGIAAVYARCAASGERPRETLLADELTRLAGEEEDPAIVSAYRSLIARLHPYIEGGAHAYLTDDETTVSADAPLVLFDIAGAPERLTPAVILTIIDHIDGEVQRSRAARLADAAEHRHDPESWVGRVFVVIEEIWKLLKYKLAGEWINGWARRARHFFVWLHIVAHFFRDLLSPAGKALCESSQTFLLFRNTPEDLELGARSVGLTDTDVESIVGLETRKGHYSTCYVVNVYGRGKVTIALGNIEYWLCSTDPDRDQPLRAAAMRDADGDPWKALQLLCTPSWHDQRDTGHAPVEV